MKSDIQNVDHAAYTNLPFITTPCYVNPSPCYETDHPLIETNSHLWKPFLKNKELSSVETIFEKQGMFEKKT
jgi:hypothetical protein